jgi:hypothetical protein
MSWRETCAAVCSCPGSASLELGSARLNPVRILAGQELGRKQIQSRLGELARLPPVPSLECHPALGESLLCIIGVDPGIRRHREPQLRAALDGFCSKTVPDLRQQLAKGPVPAPRRLTRPEKLDQIRTSHGPPAIDEEGEQLPRLSPRHPIFDPDALDLHPHPAAEPNAQTPHRPRLARLNRFVSAY